MNYEIVNLKEKIVAGVSTRTSNMDKDMSIKIGGLWEKFYGDGVYFSIENKINDKAIGLYTNYEGDFMNTYDVIVCAEVYKENPSLDNRIIPEGKYAKFIVRGHMQKAVSEFWSKLLQMDLPRSYIADFEEYQPGGTMENAEIHIYISLI